MLILQTELRVALTSTITSIETSTEINDIGLQINVRKQGT